MYNIVQSFIKATFIDMIEKLDFMPLSGEGGVVSENANLSVLVKPTTGSIAAVEIINADLYHGHLQDRLEKHKEVWGARGKGFYFFEVLVFQGNYDEDIIKECAKLYENQIRNGGFIGIVAVNLATGQIKNYFKPFSFSRKINNILHEIINADFTNRDFVDTYELIQIKRQESTLSLSAKNSFMTYAFMVANIIIWALLMLLSIRGRLNYNSLLMVFGAKDNLRIMAGEYWRFITPIFLHANLLHMGINTYSLYIVGTSVERIYGHWKFLFIYIIAGLMGSFASFVFSPNAGVGASGSIFGLLGALLYLGTEKPLAFKRTFGRGILATLAINIIYGFSVQGIDNFAHLGGLLGGFLSAGIVSSEIKGFNFKKLGYLILTILISIVFLFLGFKVNRMLL